jgi:hypothetical protein
MLQWQLIPLNGRKLHPHQVYYSMLNNGLLNTYNDYRTITNGFLDILEDYGSQLLSMTIKRIFFLLEFMGLHVFNENINDFAAEIS